jgi:hypothetical protein
MLTQAFYSCSNAYLSVHLPCRFDFAACSRCCTDLQYVPLDNSQLYAKCSCPIDDQVVLTDRNLDSFIQHLKTDSFTINNDRKAIPRAVLRQLKCLRDGGGYKSFIANPGEYYQRTDVKYRRVSPIRQLIYLAKSKNVLVMTYNIGGWGSGKRILFIKFDKHGIIDFWSGFGEGSLSTNAEITESIRQRRGKEWGLHTNYVSF